MRFRYFATQLGLHIQGLSWTLLRPSVSPSERRSLRMGWGEVAFLLSFWWALMGLSSCGSPPESQPFPELNKSRPACSEIALIKDMALTGPYLKNFVDCAARNEQDTPHVLKLVRSLDADGLQRVIDFLLQEDEQSKHSGRYPRLHLFSVLMDRGNTDQPEAPRYTSLTQRYDDLQNLMTTLDPYRAAALVLSWQSESVPVEGQDIEGSDHQGLIHTTKLDRFLDHLVTLLDQLPQGAVSGLGYELLTKEALRRDIVESSLTILGDDQVYQAMEQWLTLEPSQVWTLEGRRHCLNRLHTPQPQGESAVQGLDRCYDYSSSMFQNGYDRWQAFVNQVGHDRVAQAIELVWDDYFASDTEQRQRTTAHLVRFAKHFVRSQSQPLATVSYLSQFLLDTKISELGFVFDQDGVLGQLLGTRDNQSVITLQILAHKVGFSSVEDYLKKWLLKGDRPGDADYCGAFRFEGLQKSWPTMTQSVDFFGTINTLLQSQAACPSGLSPLLAKIMAYANCSPTSEDQARCFGQLSADQLKGPFLPTTLPGSTTIMTLVDVAMERAIDQSRRRPYALYQRGLTFGRVKPEDIEEFRQHLNQWLEQEGASAESLARFSYDFDRDRYWQDKKVFQPNFVEDLLAETIHQVLRRSYDFADIFNRQSGQPLKQQLRVNRLFWGVYDGGPWQAVMTKVMAQWRQSDPDLIKLKKGGYDYATLSLVDRFQEPDQAMVSPLFLKDVVSFRFAGDDSVVHDSTFERSSSRSLKLATSPAQGSFDVTTDRVDLLAQAMLVDWQHHPLKQDAIRLDRYYPDFVRDLLTPLGSEHWDGKLLDALCEKVEECPANQIRPEDFLNQLPRWSRDPRDRLLTADRPLAREHWRPLLLYFARHFGAPVFPWNDPDLVARASVSTRQTSKYYSYLSDFTTFSRPGTDWALSLSQVADGLLVGAEVGLGVDGSDRVQRDQAQAAIYRSMKADFEAVDPQALEDPSIKMPEAMRRLAGIGLLTGTFKPEVMMAPVIGFASESGDDDICWVKTISPVDPMQTNTQAQPCPLTLLDHQSRQPASAGSYHQMVESIYSATLCPYLAPDWQALDVDARELAVWLQQRTGWSDLARCSDPSAKVLAEKTRAVYQLDSERLMPAAYMQWLLKDLESLGVNPHPVEGLLGFDQHIRFYKEKLAVQPSPRQVLDRASFLSAESAAWGQAFDLDGPILPYRPTLIDSYFATVAGVTQDGHWDQLSPTWSSLFTPVIDMHQDTFRDTPLIQYLEQRLKNVNRDPIKKNWSLIRFALEELKYLNSGEPLAEIQKSMIAHMVTGPYGHRAMEIQATLNSAIAPGYRNYFGDAPPSDWSQDKGLEAIKLLSRRELSQELAFLGSGFDYDDVWEGLTNAERLLATMGTPQEQARVLNLVNTLFQQSVFSNRIDGVSRVGLWQNLIEVIVGHLPEDEQLLSWQRLFTFASRDWQTFSQQLIPGGLWGQANPKRHQLVKTLVEKAPQWLKDYQEFRRNSSDADLGEPQFLRQMILGLMEPLRPSEQLTQQNFDALLAFLDEPIWGLTDDAFVLEPLLRDRRSDLTSMLAVVKKSSSKVWLEASREAEDLLVDSYRYINFAFQKMRFSDPKEAIDLTRSLQALLRLTAPKDGGFMLKRQVNLFEAWMQRQDHLDKERLSDSTNKSDLVGRSAL